MFLLAGRQVILKQKQKTRIQQTNEARILEAALEVFARQGFRGSTLDQIAKQASMSKPNLLYYFPSKDAIHIQLLEGLLDLWLAPLRAMQPDGNPRQELGTYIERKLEMSRDYPRESRLFANEILRGAPHIHAILKEELAELVEEKAKVIQHWIDRGEIRPCDPRHLIFALWATTQHYADFQSQVQAILGADISDDEQFHQARQMLDMLFLDGLLGGNAQKRKD